MAQTARKLKGIIFDKDGTLFDYAQVWEDVLKDGIDSAFEKMGKGGHHRAKSAMLHLMGIDSDGNCVPSGLVFTHRRFQILRRFLLYCLRWRVNAITAIRSYYQSVKHSETLLTKKLTEMDFSVQQELFARLKQLGYAIGIITNDNASSTALFLSLMGLEEYVDFVASRDSEYRRKPHPQAFTEFCATFGLDGSQVAMIGDTITDMLFARRGASGYIVAVLSGSNDAKRLAPLCDAVYRDISELASDPVIFPAQ